MTTYRLALCFIFHTSSTFGASEAVYSFQSTLRILLLPHIPNLGRQHWELVKSFISCKLPLRLSLPLSLSQIHFFSWEWFFCFSKDFLFYKACSPLPRPQISQVAPVSLMLPCVSLRFVALFLHSFEISLRMKLRGEKVPLHIYKSNGSWNYACESQLLNDKEFCESTKVGVFTDVNAADQRA